ncbi:MAG TPA: transketolase, partial [Rhabdaerophilum sp.]|nr:transketolase [Rhabdaerophilum sp.]
IDGHDMAAIEPAIAAAKRSRKPSLIACRTIIGKGAPNKQGSEATHGAPLGAAEIDAARAELGWTAAPFEVPGDILAAWRAAGARHTGTRTAWEERLAKSPRR